MRQRHLSKRVYLLAMWCFTNPLGTTVAAIFPIIPSRAAESQASHPRFRLRGILGWLEQKTTWGGASSRPLFGPTRLPAVASGRDVRRQSLPALRNEWHLK